MAEKLSTMAPAAEFADIVAGRGGQWGSLDQDIDQLSALDWRRFRGKVDHRTGPLG